MTISSLAHFLECKRKKYGSLRGYLIFYIGMCMKILISVEHRPKGVGKPVRRCTDFNDLYLRSDMDYFYISAKKLNGELVGQACIEKDSNYIFSVSVNPDYQGIGIGKILMKKAEQFATGDIFLRVSKNNLKVLDFYKKLDYELYNEDEEDLILRKDKRLLIFESVLESSRD